MHACVRLRCNSVLIFIDGQFHWKLTIFQVPLDDPYSAVAVRNKCVKWRKRALRLRTQIKLNRITGYRAVGHEPQDCFDDYRQPGVDPSYYYLHILARKATNFCFDADSLKRRFDLWWSMRWTLQVRSANVKAVDTAKIVRRSDTRWKSTVINPPPPVHCSPPSSLRCFYYCSISHLYEQ